jgi:hypothetical protein
LKEIEDLLIRAYEKLVSVDAQLIYHLNGEGLRLAALRKGLNLPPRPDAHLSWHIPPQVHVAGLASG